MSRKVSKNRKNFSDFISVDLSSEEMVSVVIPCYNYSHFIRATLEGLQQQSWPNWEALIIDDGSTDNTAEVVQSFAILDKRIKYFVQQNSGPSIARKNGVLQSKGSYIQFLDADDLLEPDKFRIQLNLFAAQPGIDIVYGNVRYFRNNPWSKDEWTNTFWGQEEEWMPKISGHGDSLLIQSLKGSFGPVNCFLYRRRVFERIGGWDTGLRAAEDYLLSLKCVLAGCSFLFHEQPGSYALVRIHNANTSRDTKWVYNLERKMRIELMSEIVATQNQEAIEVNTMAIKAIELMINKSWKAQFLSGGPFDFLKIIIRILRLEKIIKQIFYN